MKRSDHPNTRPSPTVIARLTSRRRTTALVLLAGALVAAAPSYADLVEIGANKDNTIFAEDGSLSNGAGSYVFTGFTGDGVERRALIAFDVAAAIPAGSTISAVTLTLSLSRTKNAARDVSLHRVLADWGEGSSDAANEEGQGAPATAGDATWTHRFYDTATWTSLGGDYDATASATTNVNKVGLYSWTSAAMIVDVQAWLDAPGGNYGWMLIAPDDTVTHLAKRFDSRDNADTTVRPKLTVTFLPPPGTGACCAADGSCSVVLAPGSGCSGSYQGADTVCSPNPCPQPTGACCLPQAKPNCEIRTAVDCASGSGAYQGDAASCAPDPCPLVLTPFVDPLPRPAVAVPTSGSAGGEASYTLTIKEVTQQLHRDLPPTVVWGFDDGAGGGATFPGPTIEATTDLPVTVTWVNDLRDVNSGALRTAHYLPVDHCPHGAATDAPRTVVHLHGGHVPQGFDGYPEDTFLPGQQTVYTYPNWQQSATLWYHDHALGITRLNVYMGLAGFYLVRDANEAALNLPSGEFEVPLVIQDRAFDLDGTLRYPATWQEHYFGDVVLVNGKVWPYLDVKQGKYRFRMLNGSNSRTYRLALSGGAAFTLIGTDGGLRSTPLSRDQLTIAPGERMDVVVDFSPFANKDEILLTNDAPAPFPGSAGVGVITNVMKFVVGNQVGDTAPLPATLNTIPALSTSLPERELQLAKASDPCTGTVWLIDGKKWDEITELPLLGTTERWSFINRSGVVHPMHMHLVLFQVVDRTPFTLDNGQPQYAAPQPPLPEEQGWKDTVQVAPQERVRVIAKFEDFVGKFPYHCHILEHEDHEMMRQFQTSAVCGNGAIAYGATGEPLEGCDDGNGDNSDSCPDGPGGTCQAARCGDGFIWNTDGGNETCDDGNTLPNDGCSSTCQIEVVVGADAGLDAEAGGGGDSGMATADGGAEAADGGADAGPDAADGAVAALDGGAAATDVGVDAVGSAADAGAGTTDAALIDDGGGLDSAQPPVDGAIAADAPGGTDSIVVGGDQSAPQERPAEGCACHTTAPAPVGAWWPIIIVLGVLRRRPRSGPRRTV